MLKQKKLNYIEHDITEDYITVLARNKYVLEPLEKKLEELSIPFYYKNTSKVYKPLSTHGQYFETLLSLRINPQDVMHESQAKSIKKLSVNEELCEAIKKGVDSIRDDGSNFRSVLQGIKDEIKRIASDKPEDDELIMAYKDFEFADSQWVAYAKTNANRSILSFRNAMTLGTTNVDVEHHGISLSTVHTMKGQENFIVILMGMDDNTFPDYRAVQQGGNAMDQERNNLYVAITRAMRYLFITYPLQRTMPWGGVYVRNRSRLLPNNTE
jgi:DNA helicase-2/ATP-dependent DNA helicase PcrA